MSSSLSLALVHKTQGNLLYSRKEWNAALYEYSSGLILLNSFVSSPCVLRVSLLTNSVLCLLRLGRCTEAVSRATEVVEEDPDHRKGRYLRARAWIELGKWKQAAEDLRILLAADSSNIEVIMLMRKVAQELSRVNKVQAVGEILNRLESGETRIETKEVLYELSVLCREQPDQFVGYELVCWERILALVPEAAENYWELFHLIADILSVVKLVGHINADCWNANQQNIRKWLIFDKVEYRSVQTKFALALFQIPVCFQCLFVAM